MPLRGDIEWNGDEIADDMADAGAAGLLTAAEHLLGVANDLVPIEERTLRNSGVASVDRDDLTAAVSYDTVYAVRQHEELTWRHDPGRQAKYLEQPMHTEQDIMLDLLAAVIRRKLGE